MTTVTTKHETITIDDKIVSDYRRLMAMPLDTVGLDNISIYSCLQNGADTAKEMGFCSGTNWHEFEAVAMYYTVLTARDYEIV